MNFQFAEVIFSFEFLNLLLDAFLFHWLCTLEVFLISLRFLWARVVFWSPFLVVIVEYAQFTSGAKAGSRDIGLIEHMKSVFWLEGCQEVGKLGLFLVRTEIVAFETFWNWWFRFGFLCSWCSYLLSQWILLDGLGLPLFLWSSNQRSALLWILVWRAQSRFVLGWSVNLIARLNWLVLRLCWYWSSKLDFLILQLSHLDSFTGVCYTATCASWPLLLAGRRAGSGLLNV